MPSFILPDWRRHDRLALRLLVPQAVTTALLLVLLGIASYMALNRQFARYDREVLNDGAFLVEAILQGKDNVPEVLRDELPRDLHAFHFKNFQLEVQAIEGPTLYRSEAFPAIPAAVWDSLPEAAEQKAGPVSAWASPDGRTYCLLRARAHLGRTNGRDVTLRLSIDTTRTTRTLQSYRSVLAIIGAVGLVLALFLNVPIALEGLRPLAVMTQRIQAIRLHHLHHRVSEPGWPQEVRVLADAFDEMLSELEEGVGRLSGFCSDLAHEFRTPLTNLRVQSELALEGQRSVDEYREVLLSVLEDVERLSFVVDRLLLLARLEHESIELEPVSLADELARLVEYYRLVADDLELSIATRMETRATLLADRTLLEIAVGNVLSNALHYARKEVVVELREHDHEFVLEVRDDGEGVEAEHIPLLGTRFYRADASRNRSGRMRQSHGLGLALVRTTLQAHGGRMEIESSLGVGTIVRLHLPAPKPVD